MRNLVLSCIVLLFSVSVSACNNAGPPPKKDVIVEALGAPNAMIIDVRSAGEFSDGHAEGAIHVPVKEVASRMPTIQPDKDTQLIVYCAAGVRAAKAETILSEMGYTKLLNAKTPGAVAKAMGKDLVK